MISLPILLPDGFTPLVAVGDTITVKQPIAEKKASDDTATINIAEELSIPISKAAKTIRKNPGETLIPGDVIAVRSGFLGMGEQKVLSSVHGKVAAYERRTADLTIALGEGTDKTESASFLSPVAGNVTVCDNNKIVVETEQDGIVPEQGLGGSIQAELFLIKHAGETALPLHLLTTDCIDKILITPRLDRDGILKAVGMGTSGIILNELIEGDADYLTQKEMQTPIIQINDVDYPKVAKWSGKKVFLDGEKRSIVLLQS